MVKNLKTDFSVFSVFFLRFSVFFGFLNTDIGFGFGFLKYRGFGFGVGYRPRTSLRHSANVVQSRLVSHDLTAADEISTWLLRLEPPAIDDIGSPAGR